jgi:hypothetical protein
MALGTRMSFDCENNEASIPVFHADWTSVSVPQTSGLRGLDVSFIPPLANRCTASINLNAITKKKIKNMANSMQYIVGANCFAPKIYCIEFAVGKKSRKTSPSGENNHFFKYIVSYCRSWMHKETIRKEIFLRENFISQVGKLTCNCDFAVAIFRDCLNCFLVYQFYSF